MTNPIQNPAKLSPNSPCTSNSLPFRRTLLKFHTPTKTTPKIISCGQIPPNPNPSKDRTFPSIFHAVPDWADVVKENGMKKKRSLYVHENWIQHRSSWRHVRHFASSLGSRVILSLVPPVVFFTSVAAVIATYNSAVILHWLPDFLPVLRASSLPYQLTAPALALLLVFRTEASYSRFEDGKKAWTKVIAGANDFARQVIASVESPQDKLLKNAILKYIMAFPVALKCHIIYGSDIARDLQSLLDVEDLAVVLSAKHRPRCIIEFISQSLHLLDVEPGLLNLLESKISCFHEGIGVCEQLMGIPIPLSYTRLTSRFLVLWHFTLPIILWDDCHWIVVPATFISAASLFCIEEVGVLIEEPFPMLALDELCRMVQTNIEDVMRNEKSIQARVITKKKSYHTKKHTPNGWPNSLEDR